jgi:hypothetical protein
VKETCGWCSQEPHIPEKVEKCGRPAKCRQCGNEHPSWDKKCPAYLYECHVLDTKEVQRVSYKQAQKLVDDQTNGSKKTAANMVKATVPETHVLTDTKIERMIAEQFGQREEKQRQDSTVKDLKCENMLLDMQISLRKQMAQIASDLIKKVTTQVKRDLHILSAELKAISIGLKVIEKASNKTLAVYCDSKGALQSIAQYDPKHPLAQEIQAKVCTAFAYNNKVTFCWIPSHRDILGNHYADKQAYLASKQNTDANPPVVAKDLNGYISEQGKKNGFKSIGMVRNLINYILWMGK